MHCIQHSRFTKQDGWRLRDLSLSLSGNIAVTGGNENTHRTSLDVYSPVRNSDSRDKPKIFYSKEFDKYESEGKIYRGRRVSFVDSYDDNRGLVVVTGLGDKLEVFDLNQNQVLKSRKVTLVKPGDEIKCLSVREREIFIGFLRSNKITVYDVTDLNEIKSIILQGFQDGYWPVDMTAITDRLFVCEVKAGEESNQRSLIFDEKNGKILSELTKPTDRRWYTGSVTVCVPLGVVAVVWFDSWYYKEGDRNKIVFYSLFSANNSSFLIVEIEFGVLRIRISDRGDRMVTMNEVTGEVKVYDMAEVFTYSHLKEKLASTLQTDDCTGLANFFKIPRDQTDVILSSDKPSESLLLALEEKGVLQPYNVDGLIEAFAELKFNPFCQHVAEIYQKTRAQSTSYGRFLATLSAHLTASLPADLCDYFHVTDDKKRNITSNQNPGLSLLLALDEMGVIRVSEVGALGQPFTEMQMVQAVAKVHEYQSTVEEAESLFQSKDELTEEEKQHLFIQCLQRKIKSWYETMTPVPWKKSCRWRATDLFVGGSLILTDTKPKGSLAADDADVKMQYTEIFSHEKLKSEIRIIVEGDPGSGKTMLMSQLAYDWCQGKLSEIGILVLIPLKFVEQKTLVEAVKDFYFPEDDRLSVNDIEHLLLGTNMSKCLLLDGLEEYNGREAEGEQSEVTKIMSKVKYPTCKVVISSRSDYAQNLPTCPRLKLAKFSDNERNSYIQKVFPDNAKTQIEVRNVIKENPFILDLCSTPLLFVLVVHNVESMVKSRTGRLDRVAPFVNDMVDSICPEGMLKNKAEKLALYGKSEGTTLDELAYNGLCRGHQQLYWQKDFIESAISDSKEWVDAGVLVVEEGSGPASMLEREQDLSEISDAKSKDLNVTEQESKPAAVGSGAVTTPLSGAYAESKSPLTLSTGSDSKDSGATADSPGDSRSQSETLPTGGSTARHVPLQVRFLHKIIQEWFAANHFASTISTYRDESLLERYVNEQLVSIDPSDLHFVLRFTVALYPACFHLIIKYLLRNYRSKEGSIPEHIMDCIFLCFAEYDGESRHSTLEAVAEVCREDIVIHPDNSRLLQQAKVRMLELASKSGILTSKLLLSDVVVSASDEGLEFSSGIMMDVSDTLEVMEVIDHDGILMEEDYTSLLKFIERCSLIKEACLSLPNEPPQVDEDTVHHLQEDEKTVTWIVGSKKTQTLNTTNGQWMVGHKKHGLTSETDRDPYSVLETKGVVSMSGGVIEIPNTGVRLHIPQDALQEDMDQCTVHMKIIPPDVTDKASTEFQAETDFSINSSVIVELLPDNLAFQHPVELTIPHCLQLKKDAEYKATIFMSHHKEGTKPSWEKADQLYHLTNTSCTILLDSFCWVKFTIDGRIVDAKRIEVYAAGRQLSYLDQVYQTEVGYYPDLPGAGEILRSDPRLIVAAKKSFLFYKEGEEPLQLLLRRIIPQEWKQIQDEENSKEIPFECIAVDEEISRPFVFRKTSQEPLIPLFIFRVQQGNRGFRLLNRPCVPETLPNTASRLTASVPAPNQESLQESIPGGKKELLIWCLRQTIKRWHENITFLPQKESWRWRSTELFVGGSLILTDPKSQIRSSEQLKLSYREIFTHDRLKSETRISLEGDSGSGKTMLAYQLAYDWSEGKIPDIDILILLPLKVVENKTLVESVIEFYIPEDKSLSPKDIEDIIADEGNKSCFLLDGLEEYNGTGDPSEVMKVMTKSKYPTCKAIIISRSECAQNLPSCPTLKLELFGETERDAYLKKVFPGNLEKQSEIKAFIEDNPVILDLCCVPVFFVLVVHNIEAMRTIEKEYLDRMTPFMSSVVDILCSSATSTSGNDGINVNDQMQGKTYLEEVAYNGLCRGPQQLTWQRDLIERSVSDGKMWLDSGIVVIDNISVFSQEKDQQQTIPKMVVSKTKAADASSSAQQMSVEESVEGEDQPESAGIAQTSSETENVSKIKTKQGFFRRTLTFITKRSGVQRQETQTDRQSPSESTSAPSLKTESEPTGEKNEETRLMARHALFKVKFLHKIIQEWFAAKHLSSVLSNLQTTALQQKFLSENLPFMNPTDLHYLLRFSCGLHPPCCHFIMKHLLQSYCFDEGDIPEHIINCIFLCFAEYDGDVERDILEAVMKVCKRDIVIHSKDSRLLQKAKVAVIRLASNYGVIIQKLLLIDIVVSASKDVLTFKSGVTMQILNTLRMLEIISPDQILKEIEYPSIMKFIAKCTLLESAKLHFPSQPPTLDKPTLKEFQMEDKIVIWVSEPAQSQTLDTTTGKWLFDDESQSSASSPGAFSTHLCKRDAVFETVATITNAGGIIEIPNTGVTLEVPRDALGRGRDQCTIKMKIVPPSFSTVNPSDFTSNSTVIVELLPNNINFQLPVQLRLPHCLQLKKNAKYEAKVFISHHQEGYKPHWEEQFNPRYVLRETYCTILLDSFSWVKFTIDGKIVEAKRIQVYAAGTRFSLCDQNYGTEVGYYPDIPGGGELIRMNEDWVIAARKSFLFYKEGEEPLKLLLQKIVPTEWKHATPEDDPVEIPFECVALSEERSCPFVFEKESDQPFIPVFIFRAEQGSRRVRLIDRPKVQDLET